MGWNVLHALLPTADSAGRLHSSRACSSRAAASAWPAGGRCAGHSASTLPQMHRAASGRAASTARARGARAGPLSAHNAQTASSRRSSSSDAALTWLVRACPPKRHGWTGRVGCGVLMALAPPALQTIPGARPPGHAPYDRARPARLLRGCALRHGTARGALSARCQGRHREQLEHEALRHLRRRLTPSPAPSRSCSPACPPSAPSACWPRKWS